MCKVPTLYLSDSQSAVAFLFVRGDNIPLLPSGTAMQDPVIFVHLLQAVFDLLCDIAQVVTAKLPISYGIGFYAVGRSEYFLRFKQLVEQ